MYKSKFEEQVANFYKLHDKYEQNVLEYVLKNKYNPDFTLKENVYLESKGFFRDSDRRKILEVIKQHPEVKIVLFFQDSSVKLRKRGKMSYADWCDKHGITWYCWKHKKPTKKVLSLL